MAPDAAELGHFLQARRALRDPADAGLPGRGRRRTPGLRREEVAALAGVSIDYLVRLEQGRHREPSAEVLAALALALALDDHGRRHLFALAGRPDPGPVVVDRRHVPTTIRRLVEQAFPHPAWVLNRRRDVLAWNRAAIEILGDLDGMEPAVRNQLWHVFREPSARSLWADWPLVAHDTVAILRDVTSRAAKHPDIESLVRSLAAQSPEFAELWSRQDVARACSPTRRLVHPVAGAITFDVELLDAAGGDLQIVLMEPDDATRLRWVHLFSPERHLRVMA